MPIAKPLFMVLLLASSAGWSQQHSPYAGMQSREIKALSPEQIADLREGRGLGASLSAELNGVPGPMHVLQLKDMLQVKPEQQRALVHISDDMKASARQLGAQIIDAERELDLAFKSSTVEEDRIRALTGRIGTLNAELRAVHLLAHVKTRQLLTHDQVVAYNDARGYSAAPAEGGLHRH